MVDAGICPRKSIDFMTLLTIFRIVTLYMIWAGGSLVIFLMAIVAFNTQGIESQL